MSSLKKRFVRGLALTSVLLIPSLVQQPVAGAASSFCKDAKKLNDIGAAAAAKSGSSTVNGLPDIAALMKTYQSTAKLMKSLEKSAPPAIKSDWAVMANGLQKVGALAPKIKGTDIAKNATVIAEVTKLLGDKKLVASTTKVAAWTRKECGF